MKSWLTSSLTLSRLEYKRTEYFKDLCQHVGFDFKKLNNTVSYLFAGKNFILPIDFHKLNSFISNTMTTRIVTVNING